MTTNSALAALVWDVCETPLGSFTLEASGVSQTSQTRASRAEFVVMPDRRAARRERESPAAQPCSNSSSESACLLTNDGPMPLMARSSCPLVGRRRTISRSVASVATV